MATTYNGSVTVAGAIPGVSPVLATLANALQQASNILTAVTDLLRAIKVAIRIPAVSGLEAQLSASLNISANLELQITNPTQYIAGIVAAVEQVVVAVESLPPLPSLNAQLAVNAALALQLGLQIGAIDLELGKLDDVVGTLLDLLDAIAAALAAYARIASDLLVAGIYSFTYEGAIGSMGSGLDSTTPAAGLSPTTTVLATVALAATPEAVAAVRAILKVG